MALIDKNDKILNDIIQNMQSNPELSQRILQDGLERRNRFRQIIKETLDSHCRFVNIYDDYIESFKTTPALIFLKRDKLNECIAQIEDMINSSGIYNFGENYLFTFGRYSKEECKNIIDEETKYINKFKEQLATLRNIVSY